MTVACSNYCKQLLKVTKNKAREQGVEISNQIRTMSKSPNQFDVYISDYYYECHACCASHAIVDALEDIM